MPNETTNNANAATQGEQISTPKPVTTTLDDATNAVLAALGDVETPDETNGGAPDVGDEGEADNNEMPEGQPPEDGDETGSGDESGEPAENEDGQEGDEGGDNEDGEDEAIDGFTPEQQAVFNKAQAKLRKKYIAARDARDSLAGELESLKKSSASLEGLNKKLLAEKIVPLGTDMPYAEVATEDDLSKVERDAWDAYQWAAAAENAEPQVDDDGNEYVAEVRLPDGKTRKVSRAEVRKIKTDADLAIRRNIPQRRQFLQTNKRFDERLDKAFPDLANPASEISVALNTAIAKFPILKSIAGYREAALSFVIGQRMLARHGGKTLEIVKKLSAAAQKKEQPKLNPPAKRKPAAAASDALKGGVAIQQSAPKQHQRGWQRATPYNVEDQVADLL